MGRLTLNMLLSFAQFEREVTGERIRDKIAASKKKGMWMGGFVPLGYQGHDRTLAIDREEAETVRALYRLYLKLGTVAEVKEKADLLQLRTKLRSGADGRMAGGRPFSRGHLYKLLANPIYRGKIAHKGAIYDGQHVAIIDPETWDRVQTRLAENTHIRRSGTGAKAPSLLAGKLYDAGGIPLSPTHAVNNGKRYRYYVSRDLIQNASKPKQQVWRMPAHEIEALVVRALQKFLADEAGLFDQLALDQSQSVVIKRAFTDAGQIAIALETGGAAERHGIVRDLAERVEVADAEVRITIDVAALRRKLGHVGPKIQGNDQPKYTLSVPATLKQCGHGGKLIVGAADWQRPEQDPALINNIKRAHRWLGMLLSGETKSMRDLARRENLTHAYVRRLVPLAFLAPDITQAILAGRQPPELTAERLTRLPNLPLRWDRQRLLLGFDRE